MRHRLRNASAAATMVSAVVLSATQTAATAAPAPGHLRPTSGAASAAVAVERTERVTPSEAGSRVELMMGDLGISRAEAQRRLDVQAEQAELADRLQQRLGSSWAGSLIDRDTGELTTFVTSAQAVKTVAATSARVPAHAQVVDRSMEQLQQIQDRVSQHVAVGSTLAVDVKTNSVTVTVPADQDVSRTLEFVNAESLKDAVEVIHEGGSARTYLGGGDPIYGPGGGRCSAGFAAYFGSREYLVTAGHCGNAVEEWRTYYGTYIGNTSVVSWTGESSSPAPNDYALIDNAGIVDLEGRYMHYTTAGTPPVNAYVCNIGSTTGGRCGAIFSQSVTVRYPSGDVDDLVGTNVCSAAGDSGGPLYFSDDYIVGIVSGGLEGYTCADSGYRSFYEKATTVLGNTYTLAP